MSLEARKNKAMRSVSAAAWCFARRIKSRDAIKLGPVLIVDELDRKVTEARLKLEDAKANAKKKRVSNVQIETAAEYGWELAR